MGWIHRMRRQSRRLGRFIGALTRRSALERELSEELAHHLELEIEDRVRQGLSPAEARRTALRDFGGVERWKEESRGARGLGAWDALRQDLSYAVRTLRGSPGFTVAATVTLAVAIGATTAVFGVVEGLLLEPLDYGNSERLVRLYEYRDDGERAFGTISSPNYRDWMAASSTLEAGALFDEYRPTLRVDDRTLKVSAGSVGASFFDVLGLTPALGRFFLPEEDVGGSSRVVLSWGLWREVFGGDRGVVGREIDLNGYPYTVVGVAPPFEDPGLAGASQDAPRLWRSTPSYFETNGRTGRSFTAIARLAPGATLSEARAELNRIHDRLALEHPGNADRWVDVVPLKETLVGEVRPVLWVLLGSVGLVLLIACANVANLLLFRSAGRAREIAVRTALGASRGRVVRQLMVESLLLGLSGAGAGLGLAALANRGMVALAAGQLPRLANVGLDERVALFAVAVGMLAALAFGLLPALHTVRPDTATALREGGRGSAGSRAQGRVRTAVVGLQVGLAVVVMVGAGLLGRSLIRLRGVDPGLSATHVLSFRVDPPGDPYGPSEEDDGAAFLALVDRLTARLRQLPGVDRVGVVDLLPMSGSFNGNSYLIEGRPEPAEGQHPSAETRAVGPGYFDAHGIRVAEGRGVLETDRRDEPPVVLLSRELVRREGLAEPLGTRVRLFGEWATVVGVVEDVTQFTLAEDPGPAIYLPHAQAPFWMMDEPWIVVRTARSDPAPLAASIREAVRDLDPTIPLYDLVTMRQVVDATLAGPRFRTLLLLAFAGVAFLLAAIGVYGVVAYTVARRLPELGVRMALGADAGSIRRLVVRQGLTPVLAGAALGLAAALAATRLLAGLLYGVSATDPLTFVAAPVALAGVALLAAWLPARRAARSAPSAVLRAD